MTGQTNQSMLEDVIEQIYWRLSRINRRLSKFHRLQKGELFDVTPAIAQQTKLAFIDRALEDALSGKFPTIYSTGMENVSPAKNLKKLIEGVSKLISAAEKYANKEDARLSRTH